VTRKSYIHPLVIERFEKGELENAREAPKKRDLNSAEAKLLQFLQSS
jgi:DNA topoisomerase IB